jgi:Lipoprotein signal peptidase
MAKKRALVAAIVLCLSFASLLALDQWTKSLAASSLAGKGVVQLLGDFAVLYYTENSGAFLSLGHALSPALRSLLLVALPLLILAFLVWSLISQGFGRSKQAPNTSILSQAGGTAGLASAVLVLAGGVGNLIDRIGYGEVRDFLHFNFGLFRTGIMNLADLYILAALIVILCSFLRKKESRPKAEGVGKEEERGGGGGDRDRARAEAAAYQDERIEDGKGQSDEASLEKQQEKTQKEQGGQSSSTNESGSVFS